MKILKVIIGIIFLFTITINIILLWYFFKLDKPEVNASPMKKRTVLMAQANFLGSSDRFSSNISRNYTDLSGQIDDISRQTGGKWGVVFTDLTNDKGLTKNDQEIFHGASVTKVLTAVTIFDKIEHGTLSFTDKINDQTIENLLTRMLNVSDNDAWDSLNTIATNEEREQFGKALGMTSLNVNDNKVTPADIAALFKSLYYGKILNANDRAIIFKLMQNTQEETRISEPIPLNIPVIHKSGNYEDYFHDAGIIMTNRPYLLIIMGRGTNGQEGRKIIQDISRLVYEFHQSQYDTR